jgi:hypothetical protein
MKKLIISIILGLFLLVGCATAPKPMELPKYLPPDFSQITRPVIPPLVEGEDYNKDPKTGNITFTVSGINKITAKVLAEKNAYAIIEMMKQVVTVQSQLISQLQQLVVMVDLQRQVAERGKTNADVTKTVAEVIAVILAAIIAASAVGL